MAGEFSGYYTYEADGVNHRLKGIHGTQADADTEAATDTDLLANQGASEFPNDILIGWLYDTGDSEWRPQQATDLSAVDQAKAAAHAMMDLFDEAILYIQLRPTIWPQRHAIRAIDGIYWQAVNSARVGLNATRTVAYRQKFFEESASWPDGVNGSVRQYVDAVVADNKEPGLDWSWVTADDPSARVTVMTANGTFANTLTNVEDAPGSDDLMGRAWINDIPA